MPFIKVSVAQSVTFDVTLEVSEAEYVLISEGEYARNYDDYLDLCDALERRAIEAEANREEDAYEVHELNTEFTLIGEGAK